MLYDATPIFKVGGSERGELGRDAVDLAIEEDIGGLRRLSLRLTAVGPQPQGRDEQLLYLDGAVLDFGSELEVALGPERSTVFKGQVSAIELVMTQGEAPEVRVLAEDKMMALRMTHRFETYENVSDADLLQQIAGRHGLTAQADVDGPTYKTVQQWNQSDLAFLRERAARLHADLWLEDGKLRMAARDRRNGNQLTLIQGGDLLDVEIRADLAHQRSTVKVGGFDETGADAIDEEAGASAVAAEAGAGRHGPAVLGQALKDFDSYRVREMPFADAEATALARGEMLRRARRFVSVRGVTTGSPKLTVGSALKLERVGALFEGEGYHVTRVAHRFDLSHGFRTHFEAERAWIGRAP
ncbi:phage late control D family protein [Chitinimonas koreensis]|nr:phage late control D family protein [Chitinimonas koreensis]